MSLRNLVAKMQLTVRFQHITGKRYLTSKPSNNILDSVEEKPVYSEVDSKDLEKKRNKSRLSHYHRNILHGRKPYDEPMAWYHNTVKYKRKMLGKYGIEAIDTSAGIAWPTAEELEDAKEYERVAFPKTLHERWQKIKEEKKIKEEAIIARQNQIEAKMAKMNDLMNLVKKKVAKKEADMIEAKERKEARLKEIRQKLIAEGASTKEKIEEMLLKYEKEEKKKKKETKQQRLLERQFGKSAAKGAAETKEDSPAPEKSVD